MEASRSSVTKKFSLAVCINELYKYIITFIAGSMDGVQIVIIVLQGVLNFHFQPHSADDGEFVQMQCLFHQ